MKSSEKVLRSRHSCHGRIALGGSRSSVAHPTWINRSLPARPAASVATSERTIAREAPGIRSTHDGATMHERKTTRMKLWKDLTHYAGFDWAKDHHCVLIVDLAGGLVLQVRRLVRKVGPAAVLRLCHDFMLLGWITQEQRGWSIFVHRRITAEVDLTLGRRQRCRGELARHSFTYRQPVRRGRSESVASTSS